MLALLEHPLANPRYTQQFGERPTVYGGRGHMGVDYGCPTGTPIWAVADGVVDQVGSASTGYGIYVRIWHAALRCYSLYAHFSKANVKVGDKVAQKQVIGLSGNTGNSTGPHLHYEIRAANADGSYAPVVGFSYAAVDPVAFFYGFERNPNQPAPPPPPNGFATVKTNGCNVRGGPGTNHAVVGVVQAGAEGMASARNEAGTWVKLVVGGVDGWMAEYLVDIVGGVAPLPVYGQVPPLPPPPDPEPEPDPGFDGVEAVVNTARVNVRGGPGTNYPIVGLVLKGNKLTAIGRNEDADWIAVERGDGVGWIAEFLLDVEGDHGTLPVIESEGGTGGDFERAMQFVSRWEGGFVNHPSDPGGATNMGITIGTLSRWRKAKGLPAATVADVKALTREEANEIYKSWYWEPSGAGKMEWPLSLVQMDTAVNAGVGKAASFLNQSGGDWRRYLDLREAWYRTLKNFPIFGTGWLRRVADLRKEAAK